MNLIKKHTFFSLCLLISLLVSCSLYADIAPAFAPATTIITYNDANNTVAKLDPLHNQTVYIYRSILGPSSKELMQIQEPKLKSGKSYLYTTSRNLIGQKTSISLGSLTRTYNYSPHHYLVSETNPETGLTTYTRNAQGETTSVVVGDSSKTQMKYNLMGKLVSVNYPDGYSINRTYTTTNKLASISTPTTTWNYTYNADNRVIQSTLTIPSLSQIFTLKYNYDGNGNLSSITYPDGTTVTYAPNGFGQATEALPAITSANYFANGKLKSYTAANGLVVTKTQDTAGLTSNITATIAGNQIVNRSYTYGLDNNLKTLTDNINSANDQKLSYNSLNQFISSTGPWNTSNASYDEYGNITSLGFNGRVSTYTYNPKTNLLTNISGPKNKTFTYDEYGDIISNGSTKFTYNDSSELTSISGNAFQAPYTIKYFYDGFGHKTETFLNTNSPVISVYNQKGLLLYKLDLSDNTVTDYIYLAGKLVAKCTHTGTVEGSKDNAVYFVNDLLGSPISITNAGSAQVQHFVYEPYGQELEEANTIDAQGPGSQNLTLSHTSYTGHSFSNFTQLSYYGARYYSPSMGRFMAMDPAPVTANNPNSFNRYMYANDNPYAFVDPTGMSSWFSSGLWGHFVSGPEILVNKFVFGL
jgi:RHS repeat-associated protein